MQRDISFVRRASQRRSKRNYRSILESDSKSYFATCRNGIIPRSNGQINRGDGDIWVRTLERHIKENPNDQFVISDVRFENEAEWIKSMGGLIIRVVRPTLSSEDNHRSETSVSNIKGTIVWNDGSLEMLEQKVIDAISYVSGDGKHIWKTKYEKLREQHKSSQEDMANIISALESERESNKERQFVLENQISSYKEDFESLQRELKQAQETIKRLMVKNNNMELESFSRLSAHRQDRDPFQWERFRGGEVEIDEAQSSSVGEDKLCC